MPGGLTDVQCAVVVALLQQVQTDINHDSIKSELHGVGNPGSKKYEDAKTRLASALATVQAGA